MDDMRTLRFVLASGERCGYFTDGKTYSGRPVSEYGDAIEVVDDWGQKRVIGTGRTAHAQPPRGMEYGRWRPASEFVEVTP